jgi:hypothetical protein
MKKSFLCVTTVCALLFSAGAASAWNGLEPVASPQCGDETDGDEDGDESAVPQCGGESDGDEDGDESAVPQCGGESDGDDSEDDSVR